MNRTCGINNSFDSREWQSVMESRQLELGERSEPFLKNMKWSMNNSSYRCCSHQLRLVSFIVGSTICFSPLCLLVCSVCVLYVSVCVQYASVCVCICMPACVCVHYFLCWYCYWYYNVQIEQQQQGQLGLGLLLLFLLMFLLSKNKADWLSVYSRQRIGLVTLFVL